MKRTFLRALAITAGLAVPAAFTQSALAGSVTLTLTRTLLVNVDDAAGRYQQEAGSVSGASGVVIGSYQITRRVTNGTQPNIAATQVTLFFNTKSGNGAPENIVLEGAFVYSLSGGFTGSVSAASHRYRQLRDGDATFTIPAITTTWVGRSAFPDTPMKER